MQSLASALPPVLVDLPTLIERALQPTIAAGRAGKLTAEGAHALIEGAPLAAKSRELSALPVDRVAPLMRHVYSRSVSWALFTAEYLDALRTLLQLVTGHEQPRVLEVCAGSGILVQPMRSRGLDWRATDAHPPPSAAGAVSTCGALAAVEAAVASPDVPAAVFFAWWSKPAEAKRGSPRKRKAGDDGAPGPAAATVDEPTADAAARPPPEDVRLAELCAAHAIPVCFVSEPAGGLTGSAELWALAGRGYTIRPAAEVVENFVDVPNWPGFRDRTWVLQRAPAIAAEPAARAGALAAPHDVSEASDDVLAGVPAGMAPQ